MKAQRASSTATPFAMASGVMAGKVQKSAKTENDIVTAYLQRLQLLVPQVPKDRPVSKLEIIQSVIDYICDLEDALEATVASSEVEEDALDSAGESLDESLSEEEDEVMEGVESLL